MNLLVGGTGFVGGHVVEYLFQQGEISRGTFRKGSHLKILDSNGVQVLEADLFDRHSLHEAMEGVETVYNMVSPMPGSDTDFMKVNTEGTANLLEVAAESHVKAFVHLSTLDVYGFRSKRIGVSSPFAPSNDYQRSKAESEKILRDFAKGGSGPRVAVIRAARAVGSRDQSLVVPILRMVASGEVVVPPGGTMSFSHPRDIAQAMFLAATSSLPSGEAFLLKSFDAVPEELVRGIADAAGVRAEVRKQGIFSSSRVPKYVAEQLRASAKIDDQPSWKELGYSPKYDLKSTCAEIASWYRREPWVSESA